MAPYGATCFFFTFFSQYVGELVKKLFFIGLLLAASLSANSGTKPPSEPVTKPNVIVVVVDDQRWDEFGAAGHPFLETPNIDRLASEGATFTSAYAVTPLCSPNRASILTGQYISSHGILDNISRDQSSHHLKLFPQALQKAGYETAHVGKWHMGNDPSPRPGYDYWVSYSGQGRSENPILFENGKSQEIPGYMTDVLTDKAINFISGEHDTPFFLYLGHKAIHPEVKQLDDSSIDISYGSKYKATKRHQGRYHDKVLPRRKNFISSLDELTGKPILKEALSQKFSPENEKKWGKILDDQTSDQTIRDRSEMLLAVDESLGRILKQLEKQGILEQTVILFTSDNGYFYGEHGLSIERRMPYEEGVRIPMLVRYPAKIPAGVKIDDFALSIDIAPTVLTLAQAEVGSHIQGDSLTKLFKADETSDWRDRFLIEYVSYEKPMSWLIDTSYKVIRKGPYKYIYWLQHEGKNELYNLERDPYEMNNLASQKKYQPLIKQLRSELGSLVAESVGLSASE